MDGWIDRYRQTKHIATFPCFSREQKMLGFKFFFFLFKRGLCMKMMQCHPKIMDHTSFSGDISSFSDICPMFPKGFGDT